MPDPYAAIATADVAVQQRLADVLEMRAAEPAQQAMLSAYVSEIRFPPGARVLDLGCGTGAVSRFLARCPEVAKVVGVDPSPVFVARANELGRDVPHLSFEQADARALPFADASFHVVVAHTVLCHVPDPPRVLAEAFRIMRAGGWLAVFDGDYPATTVAIGSFDPLQACVDEMVHGWVHNLWIVRRLPALVRSAGFEVISFRSHGYLQSADPTYMMTLIERGADVLTASGRLGGDAAAAVKAEARRRADAGDFFGHITYVSLVGRKLDRGG
jgi:ubiquinone/menaquinone biosynthesis C-methylase UbiE